MAAIREISKLHIRIRIIDTPHGSKCVGMMRTRQSVHTIRPYGACPEFKPDGDIARTSRVGYNVIGWVQRDVGL